jgi:hypothetical protein
MALLKVRAVRIIFRQLLKIEGPSIFAVVKNEVTNEREKTNF